MMFVMRHPNYQDILLHVWDHLIEGDNPSAVKEVYLNDLDNDDGIANAITFYGRRIRKDQNYDTSDEIERKIEAERIARGEVRKNMPQQPWRRPKYGMGTRIDPETGEEISWTGTHERFN